MTIAELYGQYQIQCNLQLHMFRVTGVAELLCNNLSAVCDQENILMACLLHDMGNIIKFDLNYFPEFLQPEGREFWQTVQKKFIKKYGKNAHHGTLAILAEIGVSERIVELVNAVSFNKAKQTFESTDMGLKICAYADMRVAPHGVVSLAERLEDGRIRYNLKDKPSTFSYVMGAFLKKIETQIFEISSLSAEDITEQNVEPLLNMYKDWKI